MGTYFVVKKNHLFICLYFVFVPFVTKQNITSTFQSELLTPITQNEFVSKNSVDATAKILIIPQTLFDNGYIFISFDVTSLFTNVSLKRTINNMFLINHLNTYLNKTTLKNLLKINITTVFKTYKKLYEQIDCFIKS